MTATDVGVATILDNGMANDGDDIDSAVDDDHPTVSMAVSPANISEGDASEADVMSYTVTLSNPSDTDTVVTIDLSGSATLSSDYALAGLTPTGTAGRYTLTIAAGQTTATFTANPVGDAVYEGAETVTATVVSAVTNGSESLDKTTDVATGTIHDGGDAYDSDVPTVSIAVSPADIDGATPAKPP